jgi:hypothetical protein
LIIEKKVLQVPRGQTEKNRVGEIKKEWIQAN